MSAAPAPGPLLVVEIGDEPDVFAARQRSRDVGGALGLDGQDQVRVATAVSELCRDVLAEGGGTVAFALSGADELVIDVVAGAAPKAGTTGRPGRASSRAASSAASSAASPAGLAAAARLVDARLVDAPAGTRWHVRLARRLPAGRRATTADDVRARLAGAAASPLDQLRQHNRELLDALDEVQAKRGELERLNEELEETNRGVMALYAQLSGELEETNRGVVALYAELDDRGRRLREASEAKSRFLRNVSHELRTPVNSVIGLSRLMLDPGSDALTSEQRRQVELVAGNGAVLLSLVNELLDLARAESGRIEPAWAPLDLGALLADLGGALTPLLRDGVRLVLPDPPAVAAVALPDGPPVGDARLLAHVVRNLLTNAIKFTEQGEVRVELGLGSGWTAGGSAGGTAGGSADGEWWLAVHDTGLGIAPDDASKVFEEFYQVKGPLQVQGKGTGLGLPYARRMVELLGGRLELDSEPGRGSTFTVTLPTRPDLAPRPDMTDVTR